jgi:hypothetical protein
MRNRSKGKGGRSARKAHWVARSKPETHPPVLPLSADPDRLPYYEAIQALILEKVKLVYALRDVLHVYDRVTGNVFDDHGWTAADVRRLDEIRKLSQ